MRFDVVLQDTAGASDPARGDKALGEHVLFENLPAAYRVYAFYYPGSARTEETEKVLRELGESTGPNLFVNIGMINDRQWDRIASRFQIRRLPAVVVTADPSLASCEGENSTAYARLDDERLLPSGERTGRCVFELYNLFIQGKVAEAVSQAKSMQRAEKLRALGEFFRSALKPVGAWLAGIDQLTFSFAEVKIELKRSRSASV